MYQVIHANMLMVPFCIPMHVYQPATAGRFSEQQFFNQVTAWCQTHVSFMKFEDGYVIYIYTCNTCMYTFGVFTTLGSLFPGKS